MYDLVPQMINSGFQPTRPFGLPGTTASGLGSASQLVAYTTCVELRVGHTAASNKLLIATPSPVPVESHPIVEPLNAAAYPILAGIWDNEDDALYDSV
jgi:hypothetical protein